MRERIQFINEWERADLPMAGLCRKYGISRPTGWKWVKRYQVLEGVLQALVDQSSTPHHHSWTTGPAMVDSIIRTRRQHSTCQPKELHELLRRSVPTDAHPPMTALIALEVARPSVLSVASSTNHWWNSSMPISPGSLGIVVKGVALPSPSPSIRVGTKSSG